MKINKWKLKKDYMQNDEVWREVKTKKEAKNLINSKTSATWGQGEFEGTGYYKLAQFSPVHCGDKVQILYCKTSLIETEL